MSSNSKKNSRQEQIWMNYEDDGSKVGSNKILIAKRYAKMLGEDAEKFLELARRAESIHKQNPK